MHIERATVLLHRELSGGYRVLTMTAAAISLEVKAGQFVHLRLPARDDLTLRRPFSVFKAEDGTVALLYKPVGKGTWAMTALGPGDEVSLLGPLGNGFPLPAPGVRPVLVAGGYGMAALYLLAARSPAPGDVFMGARTLTGILCAAEVEALGWKVHAATEDGSLGYRGLVTALLAEWIDAGRAGSNPEFYACGPNGMLKAVGEIAVRRGVRAWLSLDRHMGCGVGVCLACVQPVRRQHGGPVSDGKETAEWARVCRDGPVFECRDVVWDAEKEDGT